VAHDDVVRYGYSKPLSNHLRAVLEKEFILLLLRLQRLTIQALLVDQAQYLGNSLLPITLVVVCLSLSRVFSVLHPILAVVANDFISMALNPLSN
jgi:hypothetical protein